MSTTWDQEAIGKWGVATFGKAPSVAAIAAQANMEMALLLRWLTKDPNGLADTTAEETADVAILLFRLAHRGHFDLLEAVNRKMEINCLRDWQGEKMTWREALRNLKSYSCQCGREKRDGVVFCSRCYYSLPEDLRKALWTRVGHGFEEACGAAMRWLQARAEAAR